MMSQLELKSTKHVAKQQNINLEKDFVKLICRIIYFFGYGDCWYEPMEKIYIPTIIYWIWSTIINIFLLSVILSELAAHFRNDLTVKERNDCLLFSFAHPSVYLKFTLISLQGKRIKTFLKKILEETRISITARTEADAIKKSKLYIGTLAVTMFFCLFFTTIDGILYHFKENIPVRTLVTYWPHRNDEGFFVGFARVLIQIHWWLLLSVMVVTDALCLAALIFIGYRFKDLQIYFRELRKEFLANRENKTRDELEDEMRKKFVAGIKLHSETLWCAQNLQDSLGNMYSVQVVQSIGLLAICLIKLVRIERSFTFLLANMAFITCVLTQTAVFMMSAGDITHEASLVSTAMFQSGWELCRSRGMLRPYLVVAIQRAQVPVVMTAFGIYDLSYNNLISILRTSYSFFAVMY